jgi:PGF-CTERM protein
VTGVDDDNETATAGTAIEVVDPNYPPNASLAAPEQARVNESVTLDASGSTDGDGIAGYRWDLNGDGEVDAETTEPTVERAFAEAGRVAVGVTVVGTDGQTATATATVAVGDPDAAAATMRLGSDEPTAGETVTFDASGVTAASPITSYEWAFGDGSSGTGQTVEHTYDGAGEYEVTHTIPTGGGGTASAGRTVTVAGRSSGGSTGGGGNTGGGQSGGDQSGGGQTGGGQTGGGQSEQETATPSPEPDIGQANVTMGSTELLVGQALVVEAEVANRGTAPGTKTVEFEVEGETVEVRTIPLGPGENRTVAFTHRFETPGEKRVEVDQGQTRTVSVRPRAPDITVATLSVDREQVDAGQRFTLTANVTNTGDAAGERSVSLELFGETVATRTVSLDAGESTTVSFTRSVMSPGSYDATVGNETVSIVVADGPTPTDVPSTTTEVPGFGAVAALLALLAVAAAARHRR